MKIIAKFSTNKIYKRQKHAFPIIYGHREKDGVEKSCEGWTKSCVELHGWGRVRKYWGFFPQYYSFRTRIPDGNIIWLFCFSSMTCPRELFSFDVFALDLIKNEVSVESRFDESARFHSLKNVGATMGLNNGKQTAVIYFVKIRLSLFSNPMKNVQAIFFFFFFCSERT